MPRAVARVGADEVIGSDTLIIPGDSKIELIPFDDDPTYVVILIITIEDVAEGAGGWVFDATKNPPTITINRPWANNGEVISLKVYIAQKGGAKYYLNICTKIVGSKDSYVLIINYTVLREVK